MPFTIDPITQVHRALRLALVLNDAEVAKLVKVGNCPDLTSLTLKDPIKQAGAVQDADLPELIISPVGGTAQLCFTNVDQVVTKRFSFRVATGHITTHEKLYPVEWALYRSFARFYRSSGGTFNPPLTFGTAIRLVGEHSNSMSAIEEDKGIIGWTSLMTVEVRMTFTDATLDIT